jgi:hypothetical protein
MFHTHWHPPSLQDAVKQLEDGIIVLSGPALAISGIIAGIDLVTGGNILKSLSWLTLAWAVTLLLTLDFQVLAFGVRAHRISRAAHKSWVQKCCEILLVVLIAAGISFVSIQMQSIIARSQATITVTDQSGHPFSRPISIDEATTQLGINPLALIWERSTLVLVLIFMSGWLREDDSQRDDTPASVAAPTPFARVPAAMSLDDETVKIILAKLAKLDALEQKLAGQVSITERAGAPFQLANTSSARSEPQAENGLTNPPSICDQDEQEGSGQPIYTGRFASKEQAIAAILRRQPAATPEQVAAEAGCTVRTAEKWLQRFQEVKP